MAAGQNSDGLGVAPWPGETVQVPQRISGWRVVAAVKLPASAGHPHRYTVVVEANPGPGYIFHGEVFWNAQRGFQPVEQSTLLSWHEAMTLFLQRCRLSL